MKLSTREDVRAPRDFVFERLTDFELIETLIRERGVGLTTSQDEDGPKPGKRWSASYAWRGRDFKTEAELQSITPPEAYVVKSLTGGVTCLAEVDLLSLDADRTRIFASLDFRPTTLSSRLLLQTLKLAKPRLTEKFESRLGKFAARIQDDYSRQSMT